MPPTAIVDKTSKEKGSEKGRGNPAGLLVFIWQWWGRAVMCFFALVFSPKEIVLGPLPALIPLESRSFLGLSSGTKRQLFSQCDPGEPNFDT